MTKKKLRASDLKETMGSALGVFGSVNRAAGPTGNVRDRLLSEVAHDLNNAINSIRLQLELLAEDLDLEASGFREKGRRRLRYIDPAIRTATKLAHQLQGQSELPSPRIQEVSKLNMVLRSMKPILTAMLPARVELQLQLSGDVGTVGLDEVQIVRIVSNLVLNSADAIRKSSSSTGKVLVSTRLERRTGCLQLQVSDSRPGNFGDAGSSTADFGVATAKRAGRTGLGLPSVLRMVRTAGGKVKIVSHPALGSTVSITLPAGGYTAKEKVAFGRHSGERHAGPEVFVRKISA
jgi:signal transduction histidine kinase